MIRESYRYLYAGRCWDETDIFKAVFRERYTYSRYRMVFWASFRAVVRVRSA